VQAAAGASIELNYPLGNETIKALARVTSAVYQRSNSKQQAHIIKFNFSLSTETKRKSFSISTCNNRNMLLYLFPMWLLLNAKPISVEFVVGVEMK